MQSPITTYFKFGNLELQILIVLLKKKNSITLNVILSLFLISITSLLEYDQAKEEPNKIEKNNKKRISNEINEQSKFLK